MLALPSQQRLGHHAAGNQRTADAARCATQRECMPMPNAVFPSETHATIVPLLAPTHPGAKVGRPPAMFPETGDMPKSLMPPSRCLMRK